MINQLRAFLLERGLVFAKSPAKLRARMPEVLENAEEDLTPRMRHLLSLLWNEWKDLDQQVVDLNRKWRRSPPVMRHVCGSGRSLVSGP